MNKVLVEEFETAYKKVKNGKKKLSNKNFLKFKLDKLNSLGKFYTNEEISRRALDKLIKDFSEKKYIITKYIAVVLPKGPTDYRTILVPSPRDRIMFSVILQRIRHKINLELSLYQVLGSGRRNDLPNVQRIIEEIYKTSKEYKFILKLDICKFFPSINREKLLEKINPLIPDKYILNIIKQSFTNTVDFKFEKNTPNDKKEEVRNSVKFGIPQGCAYSPLLANYYGLDLEKCVKEKGFHSFRYLDDMVIFTNSEKEAKEIFVDLKSVASNLGLKIHEITEKKNNKTYIQQTNQPFEYLGIEIKPDGSYEIPIVKIKKEILLIRQSIFNLKTIESFGAERVVSVLSSQIKGWRMYYQKNFPTAYKSFQLKSVYNDQLKKHYCRIVFKNRKLRKELKHILNDTRFYF